MAKQSRKVVAYSLRSQQSLDEIWEWNAKAYGSDHAREYIAFLRLQIERLGSDFLIGKSVGVYSRFRYLTILRKPKGHGHVAVYEIIGDFVVVLQIYHTSENWRAKLSEDL